MAIARPIAAATWSTARRSALPFAALGVPTEMNETSVSATAAVASVVARNRPAATVSAMMRSISSSTIGELPAFEHRDLVGGDIDAHHLMPESGQAGAGNRTDIADAENRDAHGGLAAMVRRWWPPFCAKAI